MVKHTAVRLRVRAGFLTLVVVAGCTASHQQSVHVSAASAPPTTPGAAARFPPPAAGALPAARAAALQAVLNDSVTDYVQLRHGGFPIGPAAVPGLTAAVVSDTGSWAGAAGNGGDGMRLSPHAAMAIESITKTFTAAEVLHLAAVGRLDLDAPLARYVKHRLTTNGATVRQALSMTSGLPFDSAPEQLLTLFKSRCPIDPGRHWTPQQALNALVPRTTSRPGGGPVYSSAGFELLGMVIERVTGRRLAAVLRDDLFTPAGLERIAVQDVERPPPPLAAPPYSLGLHRNDGYLPCRAFASLAFSTGGIAADAATVARWGYELYGARVLPPASVRAMTTPQTADVFTDTGYGLGTMVFHTLQLRITDSVGHLGGAPGYTTMLAVAPERRISVAVLIDESNKDAKTIMLKLFAALREQ